jgi:hypothetical protein
VLRDLRAAPVTERHPQVQRTPEQVPGCPCIADADCVGAQLMQSHRLGGGIPEGAGGLERGLADVAPGVPTAGECVRRAKQYAQGKHEPPLAPPLGVRVEDPNGIGRRARGEDHVGLLAGQGGEVVAHLHPTHIELPCARVELDAGHEAIGGAHVVDAGRRRGGRD